MLPPLIHTLSLSDLMHRHATRRLRGIYRVSNEEYHAGPGLSSTGVKAILESPAHFKTSFEPTKSMDFGTALHMAMLEPELFAARYVEKPDGMSFSTKEGKKWREEHEGFEILTPADAEGIRELAKAFGRSALWREAVDGAEFEISAYHQGPHGLRRARADIFGWNGTIYDIKTTASGLNTWELARTIMDFGYHISGKWYLDVFGGALGVKLNRFVLIFASKSPPYAIRFVPLSAQMLAIAALECARAEAIHAECMKSNTWEAYPDEFVDVELPSFYVKRYSI